MLPQPGRKCPCAHVLIQILVTAFGLLTVFIRPRTCIGKDDGKGEIMRSTLTRNLETILVVDDDEAVLAFVVAILKRAKFQVLSADGGANAIKLANETKGRIDMLVSDVGMAVVRSGLGRKAEEG